MKKIILMCAVAVGLSAAPAGAAVITFNGVADEGTSKIIVFDSNRDPQIKAAALVTLLDYGTNTITVNVKLANTTVNPFLSRVSTFSFNTTPDAQELGSSVTGAFNSIDRGNVPGQGQFELCGTGGGNCAGGGGGGATPGQIIDFTFVIRFVSNLGASMSFDKLAVRYQDLSGPGLTENSGSGAGQPRNPGEPTPFDTVPEPTSLALVGLGLLGAGIARRRK